MPGIVPLINGVNYSWANVKVILFGSIVIGVTEVSYNKKQKKENNYGAGQDPISRGYGNNEYEGKLSLFLDEWTRILQAAPNKDALIIAPFDIQVQFGGSSVNFKQDTLQMCEFLEDPMNIKQGDTKGICEIPLIIGGIKHL